MISTAVFGASGYAGGELVKLLDTHGEFNLIHLGAHSREGQSLGDIHPQLTGGERRLGGISTDSLPDIDLAFLALPHGASWDLGHRLAEEGVVVVDLGSDYRLDTDARYRAAHGTSHPLPEQLSQWSYGLPELVDVTGSKRIASPGCYPTAVLLALVPLIAANLIDAGVIVADCLSGVSGAGRSLRDDLLFGAVAEGARAYAVTTHRHRPEIEMAVEQVTGQTRSVVFTPHLVPMQRGELATVTAPAAPGATRDKLLAALNDAYDSAVFIEVIDRPPQTRWAVGSNRAFVSAWLDEATGMVITQGAIDNLVKGAAGQAVQAANIALGLEESAGLPLSGWMP